MLKLLNGNNSQKFWAFASIYLLAILTANLVFGNIIGSVTSGSFWIAVLVCIWSILYFFLFVATIPFLASHDFRPKPLQLMGHTILSITLSIMCFGLLYANLGIVHANEADKGIVNSVYFSAVTFSTLGYGDFAPSVAARAPAAIQAIIGNLHLGVTVGVMFFAMQSG